MITANKGEWSELYALFKLLCDGELSAGDENLNKINNLIYPVIRILRQEHHHLFTYVPHKSEGIVEILRGEDVFQIPLQELRDITHFLLAELQKKQTASFTIPDVENFISRYQSNKIKAKSSAKSDIRIVIYDAKIGTMPELGFSIKSKLGKPSTLLNTGKTTNFIFEIKNICLTEKEIEDFNQLALPQPIIKSRIAHLKMLGADIKFSHLNNAVFENNLILLDSLLPKIMAEAIFKYYTSTLNSVKDIFNEISYENPMKYSFEHQHPFYQFKIKKLLCEIAIGMMPGTVWTGNEIDSTGGYLVIKEDGEIICYHLYHRHEFEEYLYNNTRFEMASKSKHDFGQLFLKDNKLYLSLNLQIRFK